MRRILEKEFLSKRISNLLTMTIAKNEFPAEFVKNNLMPHKDTQEESKEDDLEVEEASVCSFAIPAVNKM